MRRRYVVSYDVSDDRRRTRILELMHGYGDHVQFSVFVADLTDQELIVMRGRLREEMNEREDQVLIVDMGRETSPLEDSLEVLGRPYRPSGRTLVV
ncbi:MAG: CRISPR-associated endoribonuclease Cas2 [Gemmatimonadaceae bacterium]|nr:CRISPR-associated endoribonuclease Cas2 [Gemmatimonadaceae bacterium]